MQGKALAGLKVVDLTTTIAGPRDRRGCRDNHSVVRSFFRFFFLPFLSSLTPLGLLLDSAFELLFTFE